MVSINKRFICENPRPSDVRESNDCTVRATVLATGLPYDVVHKGYAKAGRKPMRGVTYHIMVGALDILKIKHTKQVYKVGSKEPTLAQFLKGDGKEGHWIVIRRGHAFAVKDGIVYDGHEQGMRCRIWAVFKITKEV